MPFTPSHAVVALPFVRTPLPPAAIAVGAMTPDLPLFVRGLGPSYVQTHSLVSLPLTLLLALALLLLWRCVLRPASRALAPAWVATRLPGEWDERAGAAFRATFGIRPRDAAGKPGPRTVFAASVFTGTTVATTALLLLALAIGIATHILWDAFTHEGRSGTELLPILAERWAPIGGYELPGYKWLQHGSSVVGLVILAVYGVIWWRKRPHTSSTRTVPGWVRVSWWLSLPLFLLGAWLWGMVALGPLTAEWTVAHLAYRVLPPACAIFGLVTIALCIGIQVARGSQRAVATDA